MIIILKRIPKHTRKAHVVEYLTPILKGRILQKSGSIERIQIKSLENTRTNTLEIHALVFIDSDVAAARVIRKLNRKEFRGKNIGIAEYHHRSWQNDPRINTDELDPAIKSKRKGSRRHANLQNIKSSMPNFSNDKSIK